MDKKKLVKCLIIYLLLFLIIPISLYINFFFFQLTMWNYEIKAWFIYSSLIISSQFIIITIIRILHFLFIYKINIFDKILSIECIKLTSIAFLLGNIFLSLAIYQNRMWYYLPLFQGTIIFIFCTVKINNKLKNKILLSNKKHTIKYFQLTFSIVIIYVFFSIIFLYIINTNYNPLKKSLIYFMEGTKYKPNF